MVVRIKQPARPALASGGRAVAAPVEDSGGAANLLKHPLEPRRAALPTSCGPSPRSWSQWPGLNRRPTVYETVALPLSYIGTLPHSKLYRHAKLTGKHNSDMIGRVSVAGDADTQADTDDRPGTGVAGTVTFL